MRVWFSTHLRAYTGSDTAELDAGTLAAALDELERRHPGLRFRIVDEQDRIRQHIAVFLNKQQVHDLATPLSPSDGLRIIGALSGG